MSQLYVPDGTWTLCTEGKKIPRIQVSSQSTVKIAGGKLAATKDDRFDGNFICFKMTIAGAALGTVAAIAIAATGGAALGGILAVAAGSGAGALTARLPSICSLLCKPSQWTEIHPKVKFEQKEALLQNATLSCLLGGLVTIKLPNLDLSIDLGLIAGEDVYKDKANDLTGLDEKNKNKSNASPEQIARIADYNRLEEKDMRALGFDPTDFHPRKADGSIDEGFYAQLYEKDGKYVLAFRGTQEGPDIVEDGVQGIGISSSQYDQAAKLAQKVKDNQYTGNNTVITGHSLGGGLAAIAGGVTGYPTYTYNAAGVHDKTLKRNSVHRESMNNVQAYNASDDPLNLAQDNRESVVGAIGSKFPIIGSVLGLSGALPRASGQRMQINTDVGILKGHTAIHIVNQLEKELAEMGGGNSTVISNDR
ncbi:PAAR-like protein [Kaistella carnis]|uniref:PAAR-like protein n=1 Tax=Kaistella carnis TaxID=1241979 RepID=UPI0028995B62|nr:PAAR-like protein [Kaistella carnis]